MIKSLHLKNFQSHCDTFIEFDPFVTAIVGLNNHGKSAVLKALQKVVRNEPDGNLFITDYKKECEITLLTEDTKIVRRVKNDLSSDSNVYAVDNDTVFTKFGSDIPVEVTSVLGFSPIQVFTDVEVDLNFQNQFDALFLVVGQGLASIRGKVLGKTVGIDCVQRAIQLTASEERKLVDKDKNLVSEIEKSEESLKYYEALDIDFLVVVKNNIEEGFKEVQNIEREADFLQRYLGEVSRLVASAKVAKDKVNLLDIDFDTLTNDIYLFSDQIKLLSDLLNLEESIRKTENVTNLVIDVDLENLNDIRMQIESFSESLESLKELESNEDSLRNTVNSNDIDLKAAIDELDMLKKELKVCPTCQKPF